MPIFDVHTVVSASEAVPENATQLLAEAFARQLNADAGHVWVRLYQIQRAHYAENGTTLENNELPVFVKVLHFDLPNEAARITEAERLAEAASTTLSRRIDRIHIEYPAPGRGRIAFGGKLVL